jgi:hypothetical protein
MSYRIKRTRIQPTLLVDAEDPITYGNGAVIVPTTAAPGLTRHYSGTGIIRGLALIDLLKTGRTITVYFLRKDVVFGEAGELPSITDADADYVTGFVEFSHLNAVDVGDGCVTTLTDQNILVQAEDNTQQVYIAATISGGGTIFTATDQIVLTVFAEVQL